ncbi:GntR family transcriptional regulator [Paenibacillus koleovorans]|uniref:GntR family transcriptional regulator n=1 Tax=Paenibacillus koleovorans TaxID=121608 RepID=UPI000FDAB2B1|nr:GntR family transcriptional regulator [Paenibacillus koleovorans]
MIDRESHISMYTQIANLLEAKIKSGEWKPDDKIPTESEIMETYQVSRVTARLAISSLDEKGLVVRKQGKGTFVAHSYVNQDLATLEGFYDSMIAKDFEPKLLEMRVVDTPEELAEKLGESFKRALFFKRSYLRQNAIHAYSHVYLPIEMAKTITWEIAEQNSGYTMLTQMGGFEIKLAQLAIRAIAANREQAETLEIEQGEPLLCLSRTSLGSSNITVEHTKIFLRSDTSEFTISIPTGVSMLNGIRNTSG